MAKDDSTDTPNEEEITEQILELIYKGDHDSALLLAKQLREKNLSPLAYARILVLLDRALANKLKKHMELIDQNKKQS